MRHRLGYKKLNRTSEHRKALLKNMLNSLIKYEQITTTLPKAKFLKPQADKIITLGKSNTLRNSKLLISKLQNKNSVIIEKKSGKFSGRGFFNKSTNQKTGFRDKKTLKMRSGSELGSGRGQNRYYSMCGKQFW